MKQTKPFSEALSRDMEKKWGEFCLAADEAAITLPDDSEFISSLKQVFVFSDFVARSFTRDPEMAGNLILSSDLGRKYDANEYYDKLGTLLPGVADETDLSRVLRQCRHREMLRIAFRDLAAMADLSETMTALSDFACACAEHALSLLYQWECTKSGTPVDRHGRQQHLVVLGMGKLGAGELNFSSDVDLIFAYPRTGETEGGPKILSNEEFFVRLCRHLIRVLGGNTADGMVFRVDMGLRPYGESGPVVMSFDAMETYYQMQGREWERYAWIKAGITAGDKHAGRALLKRLNPFIYRKYLDFGVFESLREMKQKISLEVRRKGMRDNIKLGPGGIREIEFFGQIFQLIRGGVIPDLQERSIQNVLRVLERENHITRKVCAELESAYVFLRAVENRLQEFSDRQTHHLPSDPPEKERLAASMGFECPEAFASQLERHMQNVHGHFSRLLEAKTKTAGDGNEKTGNDLAGIWHDPAGREQNLRTLSHAGFDNPEEVLRCLEELHRDIDASVITLEGRKRIDRLIPMLLREAGRAEASEKALNRGFDLVRAIKKRTSYIALLLENPDALRHMLRLVTESSWILAFLMRHPVLLDQLLDSRTLYVPPGHPELEKEIQRGLARIPQDDLEAQMEELRLFKQINVLHVAASDVTEALPLMKVSDHLSNIAETALNQVVEISWHHLAEKHGLPICRLGEDSFDRGFAVIAYGKLGGLELGYDSDIDLVFLHAGTPEETRGGKYPTDSTYFFARLGQRVIHILSTHTPAGILYEADMRLRPSGSSGILVCHLDAFREYQLREAWTWEKQALLRARPVFGDPRILHRFQEIRKEAVAQPRDRDELREEVRNMRERMRKELSGDDPGMFDLKQGRGGMVDVEFMVQYLVLLHGRRHPELLEWTDNVRFIGTLARTGLISDVAAHFLRKAYLTYRTVGHRLSLSHQPANVPDTMFQELRKRVSELWKFFITQK